MFEQALSPVKQEKNSFPGPLFSKFFQNKVGNSLHFRKISHTFEVLTNHLILTKMKKLKLIFGLLLVAGFVATTVLSFSTDEQAIRKSVTEVPRNG